LRSQSHKGRLSTCVNTIPRCDDNILKAHAKLTRLAVASKEWAWNILEQNV
jgi:hypothetical protein